MNNQSSWYLVGVMIFWALFFVGILIYGIITLGINLRYVANQVVFGLALLIASIIAGCLAEGIRRILVRRKHGRHS